MDDLRIEANLWLGMNGINNLSDMYIVQSNAEFVFVRVGSITHKLKRAVYEMVVMILSEPCKRVSIWV
jgi:hypothetical protein